MIICSVCKQAKNESEFGDDVRKSNGKKSACYACVRIQYKKFCDNNRDVVRERCQKYYKENKDKFKHNYLIRRDEVLLSKKLKRQMNIEDFRDREKEYKRRQYRLSPEKEKDKVRQWKANNPEYGKIYRNGNIKVKLSNNISRAIRQSLHRNKNGYHWESILGYTIVDLMNHLSSQFKEGMRWDNYGKWEIDHKMPIASFFFQSYEDEEFKRCWALENLQPLWMPENRSKHSKVII